MSLDVLDAIESAHFQLVARAAVLEHLFELMAANEAGKKEFAGARRDNPAEWSSREKPVMHTVDFGDRHAEEFVDGLRLLSNEIIETADTMKAKAQLLFYDLASRHNREGAR